MRGLWSMSGRRSGRCMLCNYVCCTFFQYAQSYTASAAALRGGPYVPDCWSLASHLLSERVRVASAQSDHHYNARACFTSLLLHPGALSLFVSFFLLYYFFLFTKSSGDGKVEKRQALMTLEVAAPNPHVLAAFCYRPR
jgi:hypothetical protein